MTKTTKKIRETLDDIKAIFLFVLFLGGTSLGWYSDSTAKTKEIKAGQAQVAAVAEAYRPYVVKERVIKQIAPKQLEKRFNQHLKDLH